jgi:hypothetical protein
MKNRTILIGSVIAYLSLMAFIGAAEARTCDPIPWTFSQHGKAGDYNVVWRTSLAPEIYYNSIYRHAPGYPRHEQHPQSQLIAEFNSNSNEWVFYGWVPDNLIRDIHLHWKSHLKLYRRCMGYSALHHYRPYRTRYTYQRFYRSHPRHSHRVHVPRPRLHHVKHRSHRFLHKKRKRVRKKPNHRKHHSRRKHHR